MTHSTKAAYQVGDIFLVSSPYTREDEILEVHQKSGMLKTRCHDWVKASEYHEKVMFKYGRAEYRRHWIFWTKRVVVRD